MSTDKTLADVQPSARVRLGDPACDWRFSEWWSGLPQDIGVLYPYDIAKLAWQAALSAQPSPGGQGGLNYERMFVDACAALAEVSRELGCDPEQGGAEPILAAIAELREALAARQPVGEPVVTAEMLAAADAYHDSDEYRSGQFSDSHTNAACYRAMAAVAPPAQAVDLGAIRQALQAAEGLATVCASVDGYSREEVAASGRAMRQQFADALAKVDGKAVDNG